MIRIITGALMIIGFGMMLFPDMDLPPSEQLTNTDIGYGFFLFFLPGCVSLYFGIKFNKLYNSVVERCLQKDIIDIKELAIDFGIPFLKVHKYIQIAKRKGDIPFDMKRKEL